MFKIKNTIAVVLALSSSMALADTSSERGGSIIASALYLQPSFGGNGLGYNAYGNYAGADNQQVIRTSNGTNNIYNITPDRAWGFQLGGVYRYASNNNVTLDWYHLSESVNGHLPGTAMFSGSVDGFYAGDLDVKTRWDAINLEMGHQLHWRAETLNLHAGLGYVRMMNTFTNQPKLFLNGEPYFTSIDKLSFRGFGPRMGADISHMFGNGLNLYLKTGGALFIGTARQAITGYINVVNNIYGVIPYGTNNFTSSEKNILVPEFEAKLGASYEYKLARGSSVGIELGYMWMTYLKSIIAYTGIGVVGSSLGTPNSTHFDLNGAYLSVSWNS
jgi:hypothetical protein